jgi:predicted transcriptional regulator
VVNVFLMYNLYIMQSTPLLARTQIYLTQTQQARLDTASRRAAVTKSELIRRAVDQFLDLQTSASPGDKAQRLQGIAGLWAKRDDMADPAAYVRGLRAPRF